MAQLSKKAIEAQKQLQQIPGQFLQTLINQNTDQIKSLQDQLESMTKYSADQAAVALAGKTAVGTG